MFRSHSDTYRTPTPVKVSRETAKIYYCDLCDDTQKKVWGSESDLDIHRRSVHNAKFVELMKEPNNYMCNVCLRRHTDKKSLITHIKTHHLFSSPDSSRIKREIFICAYCKNVFFNKALLVVHIKALHSLSNAEKEIALTPCPLCKKNIKVKTIWFHFMHHGLIGTSTCPICMKPFDDYEDVLKHVESHQGYYSCSICRFETFKEGTFETHIQKHKKNVSLEGKENIDKVFKYFVPHKKICPVWNKKIVNVFKGTRVAPVIKICILCRAICETEEQMLQHIYGDHTVSDMVESNIYKCVCGEEFFNRVLLKHHIFMMKGDHRAYDEKHLVKIKSLPQLQEIHNADHDQSSVIVDENEEQEIYDVVVEVSDDMETVNDNTTKPLILSFASGSEGDSDIIKLQSKDDANAKAKVIDRSLQYNNIKTMEMQPQNYTHNKTTTQSQIEINTSQIKLNAVADNELEVDNEFQLAYNQAQNEFNTVTDFQPQSHKNIETEHITVNTKPNLKTSLDSNNYVQKDQIIIDGQQFTIELNNTDKQIVGSGAITIEWAPQTEVNVKDKEESTHKSNPRLNKRAKKEIVFLRNAVPKRFKSTKQFYEEVHDSEISSNSDKSLDGGVRVLNLTQEQVQHTPDSDREVEVYHVLEVAGDSNEEMEELTMEDPLLFT